MGEYLSTPNREKKSEEGENGKVSNLIITYFIDALRSLGNAGMAKKHGGCTYI